MRNDFTRNYCHALIKKGALIPDRSRGMTFGEYSKGFWERNSEYIKHQESRADITDTYISSCRKMVAYQILPFFANTPLDKITDKDLNRWLLGFKNREVVKDGKKEKVQYKNTYANTVFGTFNVMLAEAARRGLISSNPCDAELRLFRRHISAGVLTTL